MPMITLVLMNNKLSIIDIFNTTLMSNVSCWRNDSRAHENRQVALVRLIRLFPLTFYFSSFCVHFETNGNKFAEIEQI